MLRNVHHPELVHGIGDERAFDVILEHRRQPPSATTPPFAVVNALKASDAHQPFHPATADPDLTPENELGMNPADPVGSAGEPVKLPNRVDQMSVIDITN
jgi:hypothetical protein